MNVIEIETEMWVTGTFQTLHAVHPSSECAGRHCVIHNPSDHALSDAPTHWRQERRLMERICEHGVGHPDPDHLEYLASTMGDGYAETESIHGCDGCCGGVEL